MATTAGTRVAVVTGASSGIGKGAAATLAKRGWRVIAQGRDAARSAAAEAAIRAAAPDARIDFLRADLAELADVARLARAIAGLTDRVDLLLNNAGGVARERRLTAEGNEATFAGNHLGHFLLTERLLPLLRAAAQTAPADAVRIVNVSSNAHAMSGGFDWDDPQLIGNFAAGPAYCNVKLANVLYTRVLARRVATDGIIAQVMDPGVVASNFSSHGDEALQRHMASLDKADPQAVGDDLVWTATDPAAGAPGGRLFLHRAETAPAPRGQDDAAAARLWRESERLVANAPA
ncbi:MAG: SDR family NAD(P)-dependent oxidoreductase [Sphingomonas sp.]